MAFSIKKISTKLALRILPLLIVFFILIPGMNIIKNMPVIKQPSVGDYYIFNVGRLENQGLVEKTDLRVNESIYSFYEITKIINISNREITFSKTSLMGQSPKYFVDMVKTKGDSSMEWLKDEFIKVGSDDLQSLNFKRVIYRCYPKKELNPD